MRSTLVASLATAASAASAAVCSTRDTANLEARCSTLGDTLAVDNTTVWFTSVVAEGTNVTFPDADPSCRAGTQVASTDMCRVVMRVVTSEASEISLEAWLPFNWTGRFLSTGNGGLNGCIPYSDLNYAASLGFGAVGANNGHNGTSGEPFLNAPEVVEDYAYRAVHTGVVVGKQVSAALYNAEHTKSYYLGCSTGGRQGFRSAQDFADDFDGILAGAPAIAFNNLTMWSGHFYHITGEPGDASFLDQDTWAVVHEDIMAQCDGLDGSVDGIIEDTDMCQYRPERLICAVGQTEGCITASQASTVRRVFEPLNGEDGSMIYPRMPPGSETDGGAFGRYYSGTTFQYTDDTFKYMYYNDPSWDGTTISLEDMTYAIDLDPYGINTWKGDLGAVRDRGSKIMHYHGLIDGTISADNSARYYNHVQRTMGLATSEVDEFYRYFRISGMAHCGGGVGPFNIGNSASAFTTEDADGNALMSLVRWVEQGVAPEHITGAAVDAETGAVQYTKRHCKYPLRNTLTGDDATNPDSWKCV